MNGGVLCSMIVGWGLMADGSECILDYDDDLVAACVWDELRETLELQQWALVDTEIPFHGVQHGVDFTVPKRMLKQYRSKGQHRRASALKLVLQGHLHQVSKLCETCPLCGAVMDGTRVLWDCPELNSRLPEPWPSMWEPLRRQEGQKNCFWQRGLVPQLWTHNTGTKELQLSLESVFAHDCPFDNSPDLYFGGDASGGPF